MNRKVLSIIIVLTSISLIAALVTQLLWVRDAGMLKEDQFNNNITVAMKSVVNQMMTFDKRYSVETSGMDSIFYWNHVDLLSVIHPHVLDSLLRNEIASLHINSTYFYAVYRETDNLFIMGNGEGKLQQLINSPLHVSLTSLCQSDNYVLSAFFPDKGSVILNQMIILPVMSGLFLMVLVFSFFFTIYFIIKQKKLTDMKTDFVNNLTHEFKTPISTISVTSEILSKEQVIHSPEKVSKYARIIYDENLRLKNMVERVLQIAVISKDDYELKLKEVDLHEIIRESVGNYQLQVTQRNGDILTRLKAHQPSIYADREQLLNIMNNLLDNASKYSTESPHITLTTLNQNGKIQISVEDRGVGISKDNQDAVFKKFHRLQRGDIHDVKGFGIGLFYVKTLTEKMGGKIDLKSELNKGSNFILSFPTITN